VLGLEIQNVDLLKRTVRVDQQLVTPNAGPPIICPPKTTASRRTVPLADAVVKEVAHHLDQFPPTNDLILTTTVGTPVRRGRFEEVWARARREADVEGVTFHMLRHHYASALIAAGCSVKAVQSSLGHATASETIDTYAHLWPSDQDTTRRAIDALWDSSDDPGVAPALHGA
jgi:integrase